MDLFLHIIGIFAKLTFYVNLSRTVQCHSWYCIGVFWN